MCVSVCTHAHACMHVCACVCVCPCVARVCAFTGTIKCFTQDQVPLQINHCRGDRTPQLLWRCLYLITRFAFSLWAVANSTQRPQTIRFMISYYNQSRGRAAPGLVNSEAWRCHQGPKLFSYLLSATQSVLALS